MQDVIRILLTYQLGQNDLSPRLRSSWSRSVAKQNDAKQNKEKKSKTKRNEKKKKKLNM
jgi:hypothetical protein